MKKPSRLTVILFGVCAVIWTIRAILEVAYQTYNDSVFWFILNVLCAVGQFDFLAIALEPNHLLIKATGSTISHGVQFLYFSVVLLEVTVL